MGRQFPRFILANPQNIKSKGPFIIHCLKPKFICRVYGDSDPFPTDNNEHLFKYQFYCFQILKIWEDDYPTLDTLQKVVDRLAEWIMWQEDVRI